MKIFLLIFSFYITSITLADELFIFAGSAIKPPLDEVIREFKKNEIVTINVSYGGSGFVLSQMALSRRGDIYLPGSNDFMERAKEKGVVLPWTERKIAYLLPVINVREGNPKEINSLKDMASREIRIGIGNPESVCLGLYAIEIFEFNKLLQDTEKNIVAHLESCEKIASALAMGVVDAVIGWNIFEKWYPESIESIELKPEEIPRIAYVPVAVSKFSANQGLALEFIEFLNSETSREIFKKQGYFVSEEEIKIKAPFSKIGGEYIPKKYRPVK